MTSRQRVLAALEHRPTDRVPRLLYEEAIGCTPPIEELLREHCAPKLPRDYFGMDITRVRHSQPESRWPHQGEASRENGSAKPSTFPLLIACCLISL